MTVLHLEIHVGYYVKVRIAMLVYTARQIQSVGGNEASYHVQLRVMSISSRVPRMLCRGSIPESAFPKYPMYI